MHSSQFFDLKTMIVSFSFASNKKRLQLDVLGPIFRVDYDGRDSLQISPKTPARLCPFTVLTADFKNLRVSDFFSCLGKRLSTQFVELKTMVVSVSFCY